MYVAVGRRGFRAGERRSSSRHTKEPMEPSREPSDVIRIEDAIVTIGSNVILGPVSMRVRAGRVMGDPRTRTAPASPRCWTSRAASDTRRRASSRSSAAAWVGRRPRDPGADRLRRTPCRGGRSPGYLARPRRGAHRQALHAGPVDADVRRRRPATRRRPAPTGAMRGVVPSIRSRRAARANASGSLLARALFGRPGAAAARRAHRRAGPAGPRVAARGARPPRPIRPRRRSSSRTTWRRSRGPTTHAALLRQGRLVASGPIGCRADRRERDGVLRPCHLRLGGRRAMAGAGARRARRDVRSNAGSGTGRRWPMEPLMRFLGRSHDPGRGVVRRHRRSAARCTRRRSGGGDRTHAAARAARGGPTAVPRRTRGRIRPPLATTARRLLDLDADPTIVDRRVVGGSRARAARARDARASASPARPMGSSWWCGRSSGKQISVRAARTFAGRIARGCGTPLDRPVDERHASVPDRRAARGERRSDRSASRPPARPRCDASPSSSRPASWTCPGRRTAETTAAAAPRRAGHRPVDGRLRLDARARRRRRVPGRRPGRAAGLRGARTAVRAGGDARARRALASVARVRASCTCGTASHG